MAPDINTHTGSSMPPQILSIIYTSLAYMNYDDARRPGIYSLAWFLLWGDSDLPLFPSSVFLGWVVAQLLSGVSDKGLS